MKTSFVTTSLLFVSLFSFSCIQAQGIQSDSIRSQLKKDWERAKAYTIEYMEAMPANKYNARPVDSIRTFSEQLLHLASGTIGLVSNGTGKARIFPGFNMEKSAGAQTKDSVNYYVMASYDFAIAAINEMDISKLGDHVKRGPYDETRFSWLLKAYEHQTHHRGQCTIYIRLQGLRPPPEKLL